MVDGPITSRQVASFCNGQIREAAQQLSNTYIMAKKITTVYAARDLDEEILATTDPIDDGAAEDGRPIISGNDARAVIALLAAFCADYEANTGAKLVAVARVAPNV